MTEDMVIIGAGEAGVRAAITLREQGHQGPVTLINAENRPPYERPPLSKGYLTGEQSALVPINGVEELTGQDVVLRTGLSVTSIDRTGQRALTSSGEALAYDRLLIATGARARTLSLPGLSPDSILTLRSARDAQRIQSRVKPGLKVVIVGGGFIGLELAASLTQIGAQVCVLEALPQVLQRVVPRAISELILAEHRRRGVDVRLSAALEAAESRNNKIQLTLKDGSLLETDLIIAGIGAEPNTELADATGLSIDNGISVNPQMRTSDPAIFAAGDCCSFPLGLYDDARVRLESWRGAQEQGETAAQNMLGVEAVYNQAPWFWSDQYDLTLQISGLPGFASRTVSRELGERSRLLFHLYDDGRLLAASGIAPGNGIAKQIKIAERLINRRARPDLRNLADPNYNIKNFLKSLH